MTISAFDGPIVGGFPAAPISGMPAGTNPESGPSLFNHLFGLLDPRGAFTYIPGENFGKATYGLLSGYVQAIDQVPSAKTANNLAAAQTATAGTALTLVSANTTGVTVGASITNAATGATVTGLKALDTAMSGVQFGTSGTIQIWDPGKAVARNIVITSNGNDSSGTYTVSGYDLYGFAMSEALAGANGTAATPVAVSGKKAFKYISSVTPSGTVNSTGVTVGTGDVFGLPVRADRQSQTLVFWGNPPTYQLGNNTATSQTIMVPVDLTAIRTTTTFQVTVPFDGVVNSVLFRDTVQALTTGSASLQLMVNGTTAGVTGGKITLSAAGSTSISGAITTGTAVTAGNTVTAGQTIGVIGVNVTTNFSVGSGFVEFNVQDTDLGGNSTFTAAVTSAATTVTGDTRGTYQPAFASDGSNRLVVLQAIAPSAVGTATSVFGVTQA